MTQARVFLAALCLGLSLLAVGFSGKSPALLSISGELSGGVAPDDAARAQALALRAAAPDPLDARLRSPLDVAFAGTPLSEAVLVFQEHLQTNVLLDPRELTEDLDPAKLLVDCQASGIAAGSALRLILEPHDLIYIARPGALLITTQERARTEWTTRVYDVAGLLPTTDAQGVLLNEEAREDEAAAFIDAVQEMTDDENHAPWEVLGGGAPPPILLGYPDGVLMVRQTTLGHEEVAALLANLRALRRRPGDPSRAAIGPTSRIYTSPPRHEGLLEDPLVHAAGHRSRSLRP